MKRRASLCACATAGSIASLPPAQSAIVNRSDDTGATWSDLANRGALTTSTVAADIAGFNFAANTGTTSIRRLSVGASNGTMTLATTNLSIGNRGIAKTGGARAVFLAGSRTLTDGLTPTPWHVHHRG